MIEPLRKLKHYKLLTPTAHFHQGQVSGPLHKRRFHERLVYSYLAYRSRHNHGAGIRQICRDTTLHPKTVRLALANLGDLVQKQSGHWVAIKPSDDLFRLRAGDEPAKHWSDGLAYTMLFLPRKKAKIQFKEASRRFGLNHAAVFSFLISKGKKEGWLVRKYTFAGQATMLGLNEKTVKSIVEDLQYLGLIEREDLGRRSDIKLLPLTDNHLALFEPDPKQERRKVEPVEKKARPTPVPYEYQEDRWDSARRLCDGVMPQKLAEAIIQKAHRLKEQPEDFADQFQQAMTQHRNNLASKKIAKGNFGRYLETRYQTRFDELEKQEKEEQQRQRLEALVQSPEYKQRQAEERKLAAADPLHPRFRLDDESILHRVQFGDNKLAAHQSLERFTTKLHRHVSSFVSAKRLPVQEDVDRKSEIYGEIIRHALSALNRFYQQPIKASPEEFQSAIDSAIQARHPEMGPLFTRRMEVCHA